MSNDYPHAPGFVPGSRTSRRAADDAAPRKGRHADLYETIIRDATHRGELVTCEDVEEAAQQLGYPGRHQEVSARIRDTLFIGRQCVYKTGTDERTGEHVKVWFGMTVANLVRDREGDIVFLERSNKTRSDAWLYGWQATPHFIPPVRQKAIMRLEALQKAWRTAEWPERDAFLRMNHLQFVDILS